MPYKLIKVHHNCTDLRFKDFFGFCEVKVTCPKGIRPVLPHRVNGKTVYPTGTWTGVYFSEELPSVEQYYP